MKVQEGTLPASNKKIVLVLDDNYEPIQPIQRYLRYLEDLGRSPNTIISYARNLKIYWEFLRDNHLNWYEVKLDNLADFIYWLRSPEPGAIPLHSEQAVRSERTVNHILTTVCSFDAFHARLGNIEGADPYTYKSPGKRSYKPFLYGIAKTKEVKSKLLKIKEPKKFPGCLTSQQVKQLVEACNTLRDKFLVCLLYETGMRLGEALGLRHEDIHSSGENEIVVVPREDNYNSARAKSKHERSIHVPKELMSLYSAYLVEEYPEDIDSDYVFVNCWDGEIGIPLKPSIVKKLFQRLQKKTGIKVSPHLLRHTHATELIRQGWDMAHVQKRLGHADVQTTINTYIHLTNQDMKEEYQKYLETRENNQNASR